MKEDIWGKPKDGIAEFFELNGTIIREFAIEHNMNIEKYYHNIDGWQLVFQHPKGGACYIEITKKTEKSFELLADWWLDDYKSNKRFHKPSEKLQCSIENKDLLENLENLLQNILSWEKGSLTSLGKSFTKLKKEEVEEDLKEYPILKA